MTTLERDINEDLLHYIWFQKQFPLEAHTTDGERLEIIDIGQPNSNAGPDVFNAKIKISDQIWCGNVEFHRHSSDWLKHKHHNDKSYNSVILHVVFSADCSIFRTNNESIPQWEITVPNDLLEKYRTLQLPKSSLPCANKLASISEITFYNWLNRLLVERLEQKVSAITTILNQTANNWEEAFYITLCRNFGFSTNADAFEQVAKSVPLAILGKHKDQLFQIESLLFGQAGWLEDTEPQDDYVKKLQKEYQFLSKKYALQPPTTLQWKFLRLRPANFPTIRMAQFSALIHHSSRLFSKVLECTQYNDVLAFFDFTTSDYWTTHYLFNKESSKTDKKLSATSIHIIIINTIVPFLFNYGKTHDNSKLQEIALSWLEQLPPESNHIVSTFKSLHFPADTAADTQAIIQLKQAYCDTRKCLQCAIGCQLLKSK